MPYINGQYVSVPSVVITTNDQALATGSATPTLGLLLIGPANDGAPTTALTFTNLTHAAQVLNSGDLLQAIANAFNPSGSRPSVNQVTVLQVNPLTAATSNIPGSGGAPAFALTTTHYGDPANTAQWMLSAGSTLGYKFSQQMTAVAAGGQTYPLVSQDNIGINAVSLYYSGTGTSPTVTVTDSAITLTAATSDTGGTINLTSSTTLAQVVQEINGFAGWNATLVATNPTQSAAAYFDNVAAVTVPTNSTSPLTLTAHAYALAQYFAANPVYFTGDRPANAGALTTSSTWTVASGATAPAATNTNWQTAYTVAQSTPGVGIVIPISPSETIWAMNDGHCHYMASQGQPRRGYVGDALGAQSSTETQDAALINSNRTSIVWPGVAGTDINGNATTFAPYVSSAPMLGSMRAAGAANQSLTGATLQATGLEQAVTPQTAGTLNAGGVIALYTDLATGAIKVSSDRTTWLQGTQADKVENTVGIMVDLITTDLNGALQGFISEPGDAGTVAAAQETIYRRLMYWYSQKFLATEPSLASVSLTASGGVISGTAAVDLVLPTNYVAVTLNLSATAVAA